ncbi:cobalt-zinc-cadmium efflux system protein [Halospina denitrificans]|uniref:Cobalt-zinc-cadmium efflux system protein n=1 Tax=Halospina denitrificans TaxID=332522 RepID=A0A4R7JJV5_9GAMM|nr:cation diffusion facilitator family transporter [Halospina denitrificans]TDT37696.1 cobalt-zinc-cadmium efflux system protein [Halospina denitrificans]
MAHTHSNVHAAPSHNRAFALGVALNVGFIIIEVFYGLMAGSLALLADAGHNITDVLGLFLAWGASALATKPPTWTHSYGYRRGTILAAMASAMLLFLAIGGITWEAIQRFQSPEATHGATIIVVAAIGVVINAATAALFIRGQHDDLNIKGAFLHMAADAAVSLGVVLAGVGMIYTGWLWLDPAMSLVIAIVILWSTWGLFRDSFNLAMDRVPEGISMAEINKHILSQNGVEEIHDLHVWAVSTTETVMTAHLVMPNGADDHFLHGLARDMNEQFGIGHSTFQIETDGKNCLQTHTDL